MQRRLKQYMLIAVGLLIVIGLSGCGIFQTTTQVNGTVKNKDGDPITDAIVALGTETAVTDAEGAFSFAEVPKGTYTLTVSLDDEIIYEDTVVIKGKVMTLDIKYVYVLTPEKEEVRLIPGATIAVSSTHNSSSGGANAIDGDLNTINQRWISNNSDAEPWAILSFAEEVTADTMVIYSGNQYPDDSLEDAYRVDTVAIDVMQDSEWVEVATLTENRAYRCIVEFPATTASEWRIRFIQSNILGTDDNRARIYEIRILEAL
jgi:hypothetical protein